MEGAAARCLAGVSDRARRGKYAARLPGWLRARPADQRPRGTPLRAGRRTQRDPLHDPAHGLHDDAAGPERTQRYLRRHCDGESLAGEDRAGRRPRREHHHRANAPRSRSVVRRGTRARAPRGIGGPRAPAAAVRYPGGTDGGGGRPRPRIGLAGLFHPPECVSAAPPARCGGSTVRRRLPAGAGRHARRPHVARGQPQGNGGGNHRRVLL